MRSRLSSDFCISPTCVAATFASAIATGRNPCVFGVSFHIVMTWPICVSAGNPDDPAGAELGWLGRERGAAEREQTHCGNRHAWPELNGLGRIRNLHQVPVIA